MAGIMRYDGSKWVDNNTIYRYNSTSKAFEKADVYRYNGSSWVKISEQRYVDTFEATWSQSYTGMDGSPQRPNFDGRALNTIWQGRYGAPDSLQWDWYQQKSMVGFNHADIRAKLAGAKIEKVEVYLRNQHFWYYAGGYAVLGYHNSSSKPSNFAYTKSQVLKEYYNGRGGAKWLNMPVDFGNQLRDNKAKGFVLFAATDILDYYGYFYGAGDKTYRPKIRITYVK